MELGNKIYYDNLQNYMNYEYMWKSFRHFKPWRNWLWIELYDGSFDSYYNAISDTILKLSTQNIKVSGIVCDNLRVQSSAIEKVISDYWKTFIKVPCSCHTIQLSINDLFKEPKMSDSLFKANFFKT